MASATGNELSGSANVIAIGSASVDGKVQSIVSENVVPESGAGTCASTSEFVAMKIKEPKEKKLTSKVWKHFMWSFVDVKKEDRVVKRKMAECQYCKIVLCADSNQGRTRHHVDPEDGPKRRKLDAFLNDICEVGQEQSGMDKYCNEPLLRWSEDEYFDIFSWWKTQGVKYHVLAQLARDVLAIPASTVASEFAFSAKGRVIDKYCSRLDPEVVEALICTKDWIRTSRKDQSDVASILEDLAILEINDKVE